MIDHMRPCVRPIAALTLAATALFAQAIDSTGPTPATPAAPPSTMKQLMLDMIHPASNDILVSIYRGGPKSDAEWAIARRGALTLSESGNILMTRGPRSQPDWSKDAKLLTDAAAAAYKAALAKDSAALAATAKIIDQSCTTCHKQFRPNVFPKNGGS